MARRASFRLLARLALLAIAPGLAGPGAIVATLVALAAFGGDHAHQVSIKQDAGHDDFVFCHDARDGAEPTETAFARADCADDHRLHASNAESLVSRHGASQSLHGVPPVLAASPRVVCPTSSRVGLPDLAAATLVASRYHRSVVLRI